jgi:hypothetical protein
LLQLQARLQSSSIDAFQTSQITVHKAEVSTHNGTEVKKQKRDVSNVLAHQLEDVGAQPGDKLVSIICQQLFVGKHGYVCTKAYQRLLQEILNSLIIPLTARMSCSALPNGRWDIDLF